MLYQSTSREAAERRLYRWFHRCADSDVPELHRLARPIDICSGELLAYFDTGRDAPRPANRLRLSQLRQLPAASPAALRRHLAHCPTNTTTVPITTLGCGAPL